MPTAADAQRPKDFDAPDNFAVPSQHSQKKQDLNSSSSTFYLAIFWIQQQLDRIIPRKHPCYVLHLVHFPPKDKEFLGSDTWPSAAQSHQWRGILTATGSKSPSAPSLISP